MPVEAQRMLQSAPEQDIERFFHGDAASECLREWLDTPEGTMAHHPSWGHNLGALKHDPLSKNSGIDVVAELAITRKLPIDIPEIILKSIRVDIPDFDLLLIRIQHQYGGEIVELKL